MPQTGSAPTDSTWLYYVIAAVITPLAVFVAIVVRKGRKLPGAHVFRASRLSRGNHLLPAQVIITQTSLTLYRPQWIGKLEESIHMAHIASIKIDTHVFFADIYVETSGGQDPVICHGHSKGDAVEMKSVIEQFQSDYYRTSPPVQAGPAVPAPPPPGGPAPPRR
jgi:hypothetical protein